MPSWRRICKTLIKNDFWCRTLSFSPSFSEQTPDDGCYRSV
ncbi:DUF3440 domain-containing protein [Escherichia coli]